MAPSCAAFLLLPYPPFSPINTLERHTIAVHSARALP